MPVLQIYVLLLKATDAFLECWFRLIQAWQVKIWSACHFRAFAHSPFQLSITPPLSRRRGKWFEPYMKKILSCYRSCHGIKVNEVLFDTQRCRLGCLAAISHMIQTCDVTQPVLVSQHPCERLSLTVFVKDHCFNLYLLETITLKWGCLF